MKSFNSDPPSTVMISMPAMIVPFERLSPKHYKYGICSLLSDLISIFCHDCQYLLDLLLVRKIQRNIHSYDDRNHRNSNCKRVANNRKKPEVWNHPLITRD